MKKLIPALLTLVVFLNACKKDENNSEQPIDKNTMYPVQFSIGDFVPVVGDIDGRKSGSTSGTATSLKLSDNINYIVYKVFEANTPNSLVKTIYQTSLDTSFGHIKDTLPAGNYLVAVTASKGIFFTGDINSSISVAGTLPGTDVFYKKMIISVSGAVDQTLNLDRIVAKMKITFKDQIPYDIKMIRFFLMSNPASEFGVPSTLYYYHGKMLGSGRAGMNGYDEMQFIVPDSLKGVANKQFELYILTFEQKKLNLAVSKIDTASRLSYLKTIYDIPIKPNMLTTLEGRVFDTLPGGSGVSIRLDSNWEQDSVSMSF